MKNLKKILSAFLAVAMIASCLVAMPVLAADEEAAETTEASTGIFPDVPDKATYAEAVETLNKLQIITGYPDGTFQPMNNVTRAEFAALVLRMLGMDQEFVATTTSFPDVAADYWAAGAIEMAKNLQIITGYPDGTFKPLNNVSYEEAIVMIIRAIDYENYSPQSDIWYASCYTSAQKLHIIDGAVGNIGSPATRSCIAQFIYNTLEVTAKDNGELSDRTIMEMYLGLNKAEGIIASTGYTSLTSPDVNLKENEILIKDKKSDDTEVFRVEDISAYDDMLGAKVTYYYKEDISSGYKDVVFFSVEDSVKKVTVTADQIDESESDDLTIVYYKNEKTTSATKVALSEENIVIYNGKLYGNNADASAFDTDMIPALGSITALNTDGDNKYDILFIESYEVFVPTAKSTSTYTLTDKITTTVGKSITLDYTDDDQIVNFVDMNGKKLSFSNITVKKSAVYVKESNDNSGTKMYTVVINNTPISGQVTGMGSEKLTVGSKSYGFSPVASWKIDDTILAPEKNRSYTFFLDINGDIVAYTEDTTSVASANYGYVLNYAKSGDGLEKSDFEIQILTQGGQRERYKVYKNTRINDERVGENLEDAANMLAENVALQSVVHDYNEDDVARQLIKYTLKSVDGETVYDTIVTVTDETADDTTGDTPDAETLRMYGGFDSTDDARYTSSGKKFTANGKTLYLGSAIVFVVPEDMDDVSDYRKGSASDFRNGQSYQIEAFDISSSKNAKVVVLYGGSAATEVDYSTAVFRVDYMEETENEAEGEDMVKIYGYENGSTTRSEYWVSPDSEFDIADTETGLVEGDIVRFGLDRDGYVTLKEEDILYKEGVCDEAYGVYEDDDAQNMTSDTTYFKAMLGSIYSTEEEVIVVPEFLEADDEHELDDSDTLRIEKSRFNSSTKFYHYDTTGNKLKITEYTDDAETIIEGFSTYVDGADATKVFVHVKQGTVKTVVIFE